MKKIILSILALSGILPVLHAQNGSSGTINGQIKTATQHPAPGTISLLKASDSTLVKTALADEKGNFRFENLKEGNYLVLISATGHLPQYSKKIEITQASPLVAAGEFILKPANKDLKEVVVVSKRPFIEQKIDKTVLNVDASITNAGSTALEVLEKAPGITVDKEGNISLKGKQGVIVVIDGKQTYLSGVELTNFLQNMPSSNLDQIEIMTNPSARYDAAGNSGVINLKTKKIKQKGFNGSFTTSFAQGSYSRTNNSLNLNYRINKFNLFGSISGNYRNGFQELNIHRRYSNDDKSTKAIFDQDNFRRKRNENYNAKIGMDYFASKKTTLGFVVTGYSTPGSENGYNTTFLKNPLEKIDSIVASTTIEKYNWKNLGVNLNFRHSFDTSGKELTADADFLTYKSGRDQYFTNSTYNPDWTKKYSDVLTGDLPSAINVYALKFDYTQPLKKEIKMEAGLKFSYVTTDNTAGYFNVNNGIATPDFEKTNRFRYKENINAAYINFSRTIKKWGLQAGLRAEHTRYKGNQFGNPVKPDSLFEKQYTSVFPTAFISYNANENNQFGLSYGRRINRPDYEDLNPFLFFLDKYTFDAGNPFLKPMYSHVVELSHTYKQFLTTTINLSHTKDLFNETFEQKGFATIVRQGNYGTMSNASISVSAQLKPFKWLTSSVYTEARYLRFTGMLYGEYIDMENINTLINVNNQFSFKKGWSAELGGFYRTRGIEGQIIIQPLGEMNAGIQKQLMKNKANLRLSVRDILYTRPARGNINFQNTEASFRERRDSRFVTLSYTYRFGKPIKGLPKRKTGGAGDEQDRIKGGN
jgi:iron complex outermembrane receptor protein